MIQITFTPNALISSNLLMTPCKSPLELKALKLTSYITKSTVAGMLSKGVPYCVYPVGLFPLLLSGGGSDSFLQEKTMKMKKISRMT